MIVVIERGNDFRAFLEIQKKENVSKDVASEEVILGPTSTDEELNKELFSN